jgi:hypothetical protein
MTDSQTTTDPVRAFLKDLAFAAPLTPTLVPVGGRGPSLAVYDLQCLVYQRNQLRNEIEAWKSRAEGWHERAQAAAAHKPLTDERMAEIDALTVQARHLRWIAAEDALEAIEDMRAELGRVRQEGERRSGDEPFFEPGHTYRSANGYTDFRCDRVIDGMAIGRETAVKGHTDYRPANCGLNVWKSVRAEGCWTETARP